MKSVLGDLGSLVMPVSLLLVIMILYVQIARKTFRILAVMMPEVLISEIQTLVKLQLGAREVSETSRLIEDLRAESVDIVNLAVLVEERYGIVIKESELARIKTVGDLHALIQLRVG